MKRAMPFGDQVDISSDESSSSDADDDDHPLLNDNVEIDQPAKEMTSEEMTPEAAMIRRAEMYQEYMKLIPVPIHRGSVIPFTSWTGLGKSIKQLYGQPLHYLTNIRLKQWDQMRTGHESEDTPLDTLFHPCKAEASIWLIEEVHRLTTSHYQLAKLWLVDPVHHAFIDPIFPKI